MGEELRQTKELVQHLLQSIAYNDAGNNLNIRSLLKFKFYLTDDLRINEINAV
jgi:hypothetical protein